MNKIKNKFVSKSKSIISDRIENKIHWEIRHEIYYQTTNEVMQQISDAYFRLKYNHDK